MYLTNGTTDKDQLAKNSQGLGSMSTQENYGEDYPSNLSQSKFKVERSLGGAGRVQFIGIVNSIGTDPVVAAKFQQYMEKCAKDYNELAELDYSKNIKITEEDRIRLHNLQKFIINNLFVYSWSHELTIAPAKFNDLFKSYDRPLGAFLYKDSPLVFALIYYFKDPQAEDVSMKHNYSPGADKFQFKAWNKEEGIDTNSVFSPSDFNAYNSAQPKPDTASTDTVLSRLNKNSTYLTPADASFKFAFYKIEESTYRMKITMSIKNVTTQNFVPETFTNIIVKIKD